MLLQVHVVSGNSHLPVATLEEQDFLGHARGYSRSEAALTGGDPGEARGVSATEAHHPAQSLREHLGRNRAD